LYTIHSADFELPRPSRMLKAASTSSVESVTIPDEREESADQEENEESFDVATFEKNLLQQSSVFQSKLYSNPNVNRKLVQTITEDAASYLTSGFLPILKKKKSALSESGVQRAQKRRDFVYVQYSGKSIFNARN
jgi:hypothetical protein